MMVGKKKTFVYIFLVIWSIINLFPIYFMFTFSLKGNDEIFGANIIGLPQHWLWSNYESAVKTGNMARYFFNSLLVTVVSIGISIIAAMMATYALTRIKWKLSKITNALFMLGLTIPLQASIVPVYVVLSKLHWLNKYSTLIIPYSAFALSMSILICTGFMGEIPKDLDEAAYIDGCGVWGIFIRIICPLMTPALATIGIYTFLQCWNEFMFASNFTSKLKTIPVGVQTFFGQHTTDWGIVGAALVLATFPTLLIYVFLSRKIQESFMAGAIKG